MTFNKKNDKNKSRVLIVFLALSSLLFSSLALAKLDIQTWHTSKGAKVLYVYAPELPMVDIEVKFDAGSARDGTQWGVASLTSSLIGTATKDLTEDEISEKFSEIGAQFATSSSRDSASLSLRTLTRSKIMIPALNTFTEVVANSRFKQTVLDRELARLKIALKQAKSKPSHLASVAMWKNLYGNHPYAHNPSGTLETVAKIGVEDLEKFYKTYYVGSNATISIVGNVDLAQAKKMAEQVTKKLVKGTVPTPLPDPKPLVEESIETIAFDSSQTHYSLSQIGIQRQHPDHVALFVGNHILGGAGFSSLLMTEVRSNRGLVYSVYSYFAPMKVAGPFIIGLSTQNSNAFKADKVVKETLKSFMEDFSDEKLQEIKNNLVGGFPLRMDSNAKILGYISMMGFYDLPLNYLEEFPKKIEKLTKQDILTAWNKLINQDKMLTVMVGKPE